MNEFGMLSVKRIKKEEVDKDGETELPDVDIKIEEMDPFEVTDVDGDFLVPGVLKIETDDIDFESISTSNQNDFDLDILKQEQGNNEETINRPVVVKRGSEELYSSEEFVTLPKKAYMDMKQKIEEDACRSSNYLVEKEYLVYTIKKKQSMIKALQKRVGKLESAANSMEAKLRQDKLDKACSDNERDGLQKYICLLSKNNTNLKNQVVELMKKLNGSVTKTIAATAKDNVPEEAVSNPGETIVEYNKTCGQYLKQSVVSLIKDRDTLQDQLDKRTEQLKMVQEKYGKTIIALSTERRKAEALKTNSNSTEKKKGPPLVWTIRK